MKLEMDWQEVFLLEDILLDVLFGVQSAPSAEALEILATLTFRLQEKIYADV